MSHWALLPANPTRTFVSLLHRILVAFSPIERNTQRRRISVTSSLYEHPTWKYGGFEGERRYSAPAPPLSITGFWTDIQRRRWTFIVKSFFGFYVWWFPCCLEYSPRFPVTPDTECYSISLLQKILSLISQCLQNTSNIYSIKDRIRICSSVHVSKKCNVVYKNL
jgi:hypothetical protein